MNKDYTTYPEGFEELVKDLDFPVEGEDARRAFIVGFIDSLIKQ